MPFLLNRQDYFIFCILQISNCLFPANVFYWMIIYTTTLYLTCTLQIRNSFREKKTKKTKIQSYTRIFLTLFAAYLAHIQITVSLLYHYTSNFIHLIILITWAMIITIAISSVCLNFIKQLISFQNFLINIYFRNSILSIKQIRTVGGGKVLACTSSKFESTTTGWFEIPVDR